MSALQTGLISLEAQMHSTLSTMSSRSNEGLGSWKRSARVSADGKTISIRVAASLSDLMQVVAIRGAVYMGEQACPYDEEFGGTPLVFEIARAAKELCRVKGYTRIYGHALERLIPFWKRLGARPMEPRRPVIFSDFSYTEMLIPTERHPNALSLESDPYVLIRPEGEWDKPGPLEVSAQRPVTSPLRNQQAA